MWEIGKGLVTPLKLQAHLALGIAFHFSRNLPTCCPLNPELPEVLKKYANEELKGYTTSKTSKQENY
jgi:hypothetical protein